MTLPMKRDNRDISVRQRKINSLLVKKISEILKSENFSGIRGLVTVHQAQVTPDLREAKVWFSSFGQPASEVLQILNKELYQIQGLLYKDAFLRIVPKIKFFIDTSTEYSAHIGKLFNKLEDE